MEHFNKVNEAIKTAINQPLSVHFPVYLEKSYLVV